MTAIKTLDGTMAVDRSSFITVIFISGGEWQWIWADALPATLTREPRAHIDIVHESCKTSIKEHWVVQAGAVWLWLFFAVILLNVQTCSSPPALWLITARRLLEMFNFVFLKILRIQGINIWDQRHNYSSHLE